MRTLCDACEAAPARLFCAADEAALCIKCDKKVHGCNKLASRHVRLDLAEARAPPKSCDICEKASAFFFCEIDGTSLCLQCDMDVHVGGKRAHQRYLMMAQRVQIPGNETEENVGEHVIEGQKTVGKKPPVEHKNSQLKQRQAGDASAMAMAMAVDDRALPFTVNTQMLAFHSNRPPHQQGKRPYRIQSIRPSMELANGSDDDIVKGLTLKAKEGPNT